MCQVGTCPRSVTPSSGFSPCAPIVPSSAISPEDLAGQLDMAKIAKGKLPHWFVSKREGDDYVPDEASAKIDVLLDKLRRVEKMSFDEEEGSDEEQGQTDDGGLTLD